MVNLAILFVQIARHYRGVCKHDLVEVETWWGYWKVHPDRARRIELESLSAQRTRIGYPVNCLSSK